MDKFASANALLDFAIGQEEEAAAFYTSLAGKVKEPAAAIFRGFAKEEEGHKAKLLDVKAGKKFAPIEGKIKDLKIGDYLVVVEPADEVSYQDALVIAMKKEKAAFKLYMTLAEQADNRNLKKLMIALAQEEAKHKLRFEIEYDEKVLAEN